MAADASDGSRRVVLVALGGNLAIALAKFAAFAFTGSSAILTEGVHSLVDTADQVLLLIGQSRAAKASDDSHPFGYGLEAYFWSFIVALMVFLSGGVVAIWQGVHRVLHPEPLHNLAVLLGVIAISAVSEGLSFRTAYREYRNVVRGYRVRLFRFVQVSKDPNVFAVLLEDGAALIGLGLAALGVILSGLLHLEWADGAASIAIGLLLVVVAAVMANETRSLIAGEAAAPPIQQELSTALGHCGDLGELVRMRTLHLGPQCILVALSWRFPDGLADSQLRATAAELERRLTAAEPRVAFVLFERPPA